MDQWANVFTLYYYSPFLLLWFKPGIANISYNEDPSVLISLLVRLNPFFKLAEKWKSLVIFINSV